MLDTVLRSQMASEALELIEQGKEIEIENQCTGTVHKRAN
jgi:hypothetical protein